MTKKKNKKKSTIGLNVIVGILLIFLSIYLISAGEDTEKRDCTGWQNFNPLCWIGTNVQASTASSARFFLAIIVGIGGLILVLRRS